MIHFLYHQLLYLVCTWRMVYYFILYREERSNMCKSDKIELDQIDNIIIAAINQYEENADSEESLMRDFQGGF